GGAVVSGARFTWESDGPAVAEVSPDGLVTARSAGSARVTVTSEGKSASATITVTPAPAATVTVTPATLNLKPDETGQLSAAAADASGQPVSGAAFAWTTADAAIATVSATGEVK